MAGSRKRRSLIVAVVVPILWATTVGEVRAGFVIEFEAIVPKTPTDFNTLVTIPRFDPALGILNMVVVRLSACFEALLQAENLAPVPGVLTGDIDESVTITPPPPIMPIAPFLASINTVQGVGAFDGTADLMGPSATSWQIMQNMQMPDLIFTQPGDLTQFTGLVPLEFGVAGDGSFFVDSSTGNMIIQGVTKAGATILIQYHYIPEPAALLLLAFALPLLRTRRRR